MTKIEEALQDEIDMEEEEQSRARTMECLKRLRGVSSKAILSLLIVEGIESDIQQR